MNELIIWKESRKHLPGYGEPVLAITQDNDLVIATLEGEQRENRDDDEVWWLDSECNEIDVAWWAEVMGPK
jgi:hypothetical protein